MRPAFGSTDESAESIFYRPSPARILDILRNKTAALASPTTLAEFPSLVAQILRNGLDEGILDAYKSALDPQGEEGTRDLGKRRAVAEQARTRVACEVIGGYLSPDVFQSLVSSYEYVPSSARTRARLPFLGFPCASLNASE